MARASRGFCRNRSSREASTDVLSCNRVSNSSTYHGSNIRKETLGHRLVNTYDGVVDAYHLAWTDLSEYYDSASKLKATLVRILRDLKEKFGVQELVAGISTPSREGILGCAN